MERAAAIETATYLIEFPSQVRLVRTRPLPDGVPALLRIAAQDAESINQAAAWLGKSPEAVRHAAAFFIEQILLDPDADSYRVLGGTPEMSNTELRRNMALLLRWLHPDLDPKGERSVFARRVTRAWNDLKTEERRAAYDRARRSSEQISRRKKRAASTFAHKQAPQPGLHSGNRHGAQSAPRLPDELPGGFLGRALLSLLNRFAQ